jgi:hypothetical protein
MTWTKLGDEFGPESGELTNGEFRTHVEALVYSNWRLLDLYVPKSEVRRFAGSADAAADVDGLVAKGWWKDACDAWYIGVRFPEWQRNRSQVEERRAYLAEAQRRSRAHKAGDHSLCLPSNCKSLRSTDESTVDSTVDPGRVGTVTGSALRPKVKSIDTAAEVAAFSEVDGRGSGSVAISEKHRDHDGPNGVVHDDQQIPLNGSADASVQTDTRASGDTQDDEDERKAGGNGYRPEPRRFCPVCGGTVSVMVSGTLRRHKNDRSRWCEGAGRPPLAEAAP